MRAQRNDEVTVRNERGRRNSGRFLFGLLQFRQLPECLLTSVKVTKAHPDLGETSKQCACIAEHKLGRHMFSVQGPWSLVLGYVCAKTHLVLLA